MSILTDPPKADLSLVQQAEALRSEARMILPGVQALFGFQLVIVFAEPGFSKLSHAGQILHMVATVLSALSAALLIAPAAIHLQRREFVTEKFLHISTRLMRGGLALIALATCLDFLLLARIIIGRGAGIILAVILLAAFTGLWFVAPRLKS